MEYLLGGLLAGSVFIFGYACRALAQEATGGRGVTMGGWMHFPGYWLAGSVPGAAGLVPAAGLPWWRGLALFSGLYFEGPCRPDPRSPVSRCRSPRPRHGFEEFIRRTQREAGHNGRDSP